MTALYCIAALWIALQIPAGILVGRFIRLGMGSHEEAL